MVHLFRRAFVAGFAVLGACRGEAIRFDVAPDHPASSLAPEAPVAAPSPTLALGGASPPAASKPKDAAAPGLDGAYVCPMHPEVKADEAGRCSKCGMKLVETKEHRHGSGERR